MFCTTCGTKLGADARFCTGCGQPLAGSEPPASSPTVAPDRIVADVNEEDGRSRNELDSKAKIEEESKTDLQKDSHASTPTSSSTIASDVPDPVPSQTSRLFQVVAGLFHVIWCIVRFGFKAIVFISGITTAIMGGTAASKIRPAK